MSALSHIKSNGIADFTGTVTVFNSAGVTETKNATEMVRPSDWNSAHNFFQTISGNTLGTSTASGTNLVFGASGGLTLSHSTAAGAATLWASVASPDGGVFLSAAGSSQSAGQIVFSNSNGVGFGMNGSTVTASHNGLTSQSAQTIGVYGSSQTFGQSSSSTVDGRSLSVVGSGGVSVGMSAGSLLISGQTTVAQSAQTQSNVQGVIVSDTTYRTGDVSFSNANGISFGSSAGQAVTISHGLQFTSATSAITSNALHTSASRVINIVAATNSTGGGAASLSSNVSFSAANGITFYTSAGGAIVGSHNALTTARASTDAIGLNTAQTNVTWTVNSSGLSFNAVGYAGTGTSKTGGAAMTLNSNGLQFNGSSLAGVSTGFTGANLSASMTLNSSGLALSMSAAAPGAATISAYAVSNTTQGTSGTFPGSMSFQGVGGVSAGISNGSVVIEGPALSSLSATGALSASSNGSTISLGVGTVTASIIGNTTQTSTGSINLNALVFSGAGGASLGISSGTIIVSGATGGGGGAAISAAGSSQNAGTIVFSNLNGVTFGMNGSTVTASVAGASAGVAALGASNTTYTSGTVSLVAGAGAITIGSDTGQRISFAVPATSSLVGVSGISVSTNGSTVSVYQAPVLTRYLFEPPGASSAGSAMTQGSMSIQRVFIPDAITMSRVDIPVQISLASSGAANTGNLLISSGLVIYTANGSTLNPVIGAFGTTTYTHASNTANFNSITGPRYASFPIATALSPGEYFVGVQLSTNNNSSIGTATTALAATISLQHGAIYTASQWAEFGAVTATSVNMRPFVGVAASVTATAQTQQMSNITHTGTALQRANIAVGFRG